MIKKLHILLMEDDRRTRTLLSGYLTEKGYEIFSAENGLEGLRILGQNTIDLVITDYAMPHMDGKEFILQSKINHPCLPVILISGFDLDENKDLQSIKGILFDYFKKPINLKQLQSAVKKAEMGILYE